MSIKINATVSEFYEWEPLPDKNPLTGLPFEPTARDKQQHKVKQSADGRWLARVNVKEEASWECNIHETQIWDRYIFMELKGLEKDRDQVIVEYVDSFVASHHFKTKNVIDIEVVDEGPQVDAFRAHLVKQLTDGGERRFDDQTVEEILKLYNDTDSDVENALERHFNVAPVKE